MANNFYQLKDSPEVFTGTTDEAGKIIKGDAFGTEESFIKAGGIRGTDKYWENVSTITPESLSPTKAYDLKDMPQNAINDADVSVVGAEEQAKINTQAKAKEEETAESDILKTLTQLESEGTEQAAAEEAAGIPGFQKEQADVTGQIAVKTAEYNQLKAQEEALKTQFEGMAGITLSEVSGRKGVIERQFLARKNAAASDIALLQAQSLAISGKQIAAQGAVDRAIDLKYDSKRQKLDTQKFLYDVIRGDLTKAEEEQLRIQEEATAREEAVLEETKNIEKAEKATLLSQMNQYPDAGIQVTDTIEQANQKITQNSAIYRQQTRLADGTDEDEDLTDMEFDFQEGARLVIAAEGISPEVSGEQYGKLLDAMMEEYPTLTRSSADKMLMDSVNSLKGQQPQTIEQPQEEENIGSDFVAEIDNRALFGLDTTTQQIQEKQTREGETESAKKKREAARQQAIRNGLVFYTDPTTGERLLTSQK